MKRDPVKFIEFIDKAVEDLRRQESERVEAELQRLLNNGISQEELVANYVIICNVSKPFGQQRSIVSEEVAEAMSTTTISINDLQGQD